MNYRHIYHAGNFADVFKHVLLITLVRSLSVKDKPWCYLETHAGIGHYDLQAQAAQKTHEADGGIFKLWEVLQIPHILSAMPVAVTDYLKLVRTWNEQHVSSVLRFYPGSPVLIRHCLRSHDRMVLTELHPEDSVALKQQFRGDKQVAVHHLDGYLGLKAFLPPVEARGLIFIDPPFEKVDEFELILHHLHLALRRFSSGVYAIWYPIKSLPGVKRFYTALLALGLRSMVCCEFRLPKGFQSPPPGLPARTHASGAGLDACGMVIINPPWQWPEKANIALSWLSQNLTKPAGSYKVEWLTSN